MTWLSGRRLSSELREEIDHGPTWSYPWTLARGVTTTPHRPWLAALTDTASQMVEPHARAALRAAGPHATAIDIACNEGLFAHRLLEWGADTVVGVDSRELNIRRARLIRDQLGVAAERLEFTQADLFDLDAAELGQFDVVALLGIVYHLENPMGALRLARSLTRGVCLIESQVVDIGPLRWKTPEDEDRTTSAGFAFYREPETETKLSPLAAMPGVVSLIPNREALVEMAAAAGFPSIEVVEPPSGAHPEHSRGKRAVVIAHA